MALKYLLVVLFVFPFLSAHSQYPVYQKPTDCVCKKVALADTLSLIKQAARIEAISFQYYVDAIPDENKEPERWKQYNKDKIKRKTRVQIWDWETNSLVIRLDSSIIQERRLLSAKETKRLYQVLFRYVSDSTNYAPMEEVVSYDPDHAFIFYDQANQPFAYLEFCLPCRLKSFGTKEFYYGDYCESKNDLIRAFFKSLNWQYALKE